MTGLFTSIPTSLYINVHIFAHIIIMELTGKSLKLVACESVHKRSNSSAANSANFLLPVLREQLCRGKKKTFWDCDVTMLTSAPRA